MTKCFIGRVEVDGLVEALVAAPTYYECLDELSRYAGQYSSEYKESFKVTIEQEINKCK